MSTPKVVLSIVTMLSIQVLTVWSGQSENVSIIELVANPYKYHGKLVEVTGYLMIEFEGNAVYLTGEDRKARNYKNSLWVNLNEGIVRDEDEYNGKYVLIEGIFNSEDTGHLNLWSGSIDIQRIEVLNQQSQVRDVLISKDSRRMDDADPAKDFKEAIQKKDFRFVGIYGYSLVVPGVPNYQEQYAKSNGVEVIEGTSDAILNKEHAQLQEKARIYAEKYNKLLLEHLKSNPKKK